MNVDLQQRLDEAVMLARRAQHERAQACADLADARGTIRVLRCEVNVLRELLAYHGLTPVEEQPCA